VFFPVGAVAFRIFRIIRIFRLFRINTYYDSLNAITEVLSKKRQQLASSVFIILVLMLASSLCMYSVEHEAQPEVFRNAFSGLWWSVSTLLTVGYGDIYPITTLGKILGIVITFLGVGMVAIPTGIISAGFVEQYSRMQNSERLAREKDIQFIKIRLQQKDPWVGRPVSQLELPYGLILTAIHRGHDVLVPKGDLTLEQNDTVILGAEPLPGDLHVELKQVTLLSENPWNDQYVRDLDISRQSVIVMIKRGKRVIIPNGGTRLKEGDTLLLHSKVSIPGGTVLQI
jgi:NhaP-type Na+/H+ and K+/H+ antiporters with a unique C-terminal domain